MENRINIAELLKDCPKGMELDCAMWDDVIFEKVQSGSYPIRIRIKDAEDVVADLTEFGEWNYTKASKCVIFPKGKTTWEGFQRPFKDGDVVAYDDPYGNISQVFIFKNKNENNTLSDCYLMLEGDELVLEDGMYYITRLATKKEKQKLFDVIKANDYKWNAETKTLEKLIESKFKIGDIIKDKCGLKWKVINKNSHYYEVALVLTGTSKLLEIKAQDDYELVPNKFDISTLKPFDKVLVRHDRDNTWCGSLFSHINHNSRPYWYKYVTTAGKSYQMCIPYKNNEYLLGTTDDCDDFYKIWE